MTCMLACCILIYSIIHPSIFVCLLVGPSVCLSVYPCACFFVHLSVCLSVCLSVVVSAYMFVFVCVFVRLCLCICSSIFLSIHLLVSQSIILYIFRMDTTLVDFSDMKWQRGDVSFLFNGDAQRKTTSIVTTLVK